MGAARVALTENPVSVATGMGANVDAYGEHVIGIRLDDGSARFENWSESADHEALFASDTIWNDYEPMTLDTPSGDFAQTSTVPVPSHPLPAVN